MNLKLPKFLSLRLSTAFRLLMIVAVVLSAFSFYFHTSTSRVEADELSDLNSKILQKEKEKNDTLNKIKDIEKKIQNLLDQKGDINAKVANMNTLKSQKSNLDSEIATLENQIREQEKAVDDYLNKVRNGEASIQEQTNYLYKLTFSNTESLFNKESDIEEYFTQTAKTNASIELFKQQVKAYQSRINEALNIKETIAKEKNDVVASRNSLNTQIAKIQGEVNAFNIELAKSNNTKKNLDSKLNETSSQLKNMSATQAKLLQAELAKMQNNKQVTTTPIEKGQYYFKGRGRDLVEGHGLGMSQFGAYGMAQSGWTYDKILKFYYTGVQIGEYDEPEMIVVDGKTNGPIPFDDYLAGIGEVPNGWPAEAIKAQVVAARTYAMRAAKKGDDGHYHICGTDVCQVYVGGTGKKQYVLETKKKVILHNGQPITAYYSASHRGQSTNLNAAWGGTDLPYIQPVNDDQYAYKDYSYDDPYNPGKKIKPYYWEWKTNGYSLEDLTNIFSKSPRLDVGKVKQIDIQKDSTGRRVARITLIGDKGKKTLTGWDFRSIFNANTPFNDYIYSTEFVSLKQQ